MNTFIMFGGYEPHLTHEGLLIYDNPVEEYNSIFLGEVFTIKVIEQMKKIGGEWQTFNCIKSIYDIMSINNYGDDGPISLFLKLEEFMSKHTLTPRVFRSDESNREFMLLTISSSSDSYSDDGADFMLERC